MMTTTTTPTTYPVHISLAECEQCANISAIATHSLHAGILRADGAIFVDDHYLFPRGEDDPADYIACETQEELGIYWDGGLFVRLASMEEADEAQTRFLDLRGLILMRVPGEGLHAALTLAIRRGYRFTDNPFDPNAHAVSLDTLIAVYAARQ